MTETPPESVHVAYPPIKSKKDFERYFQGLLADWEMIHYKTDHFIVEGDNIAVRGSTTWRNRKTGKVCDTPKADFWTFRDGKVVSSTSTTTRRR